MFTTTKALTEAQEALASITAERDAALLKVQEHEGRATALDGELANAKAQITALETAKTQAEQSAVDANAALEQYKADFETKVAAEVVNRASAAGVPPVHRDSSALDEVKSLKRAEFDKLSHSARNAHIRSGGKVID